MARRLTAEEIDAARSPRGGWTKATLAGWGVPWPAPHGWRKALLRGEPIPVVKPKPAPADEGWSLWIPLTPELSAAVDDLRALGWTVEPPSSR